MQIFSDDWLTMDWVSAEGFRTKHPANVYTERYWSGWIDLPAEQYEICGPSGEGCLRLCPPRGIGNLSHYFWYYQLFSLDDERRAKMLKKTVYPVSVVLPQRFVYVGKLYQRGLDMNLHHNQICGMDLNLSALRNFSGIKPQSMLGEI